METALSFVVSLSLLGIIHAGPICMRCINVADISNCVTNTIQCGYNEQCYLESILNEDLRITYNAGCQSNTVCSTLVPTYVGYKKRGLVNCAACCNEAPGNDGPCNAHLCGVSPGDLQKTCAVCDGVHSDVAQCTTTAVCPPNELCFSGIRIVQSAIRYVVGCYEERVCKAIIDNDRPNSTISRPGRIIHGDLGIRICDACCKGYRCNAADCFTLRKNMTALFDSAPRTV
nr:uncharacterized protein LOC105333978 isoform X1 [Crassostrea gigas]